MTKLLTTFIFLFLSISSYSQSKSIVGSWISLDSIHKTQFFIKADGGIEKRTAIGKEDIWEKKPIQGTYTFKDRHSLVINWRDKSTEVIEVKFTVDGNAEFRFTKEITKSQKAYVFLRIIDEEIISN